MASEPTEGGDRSPTLSKVKTLSVTYGRKINLGDFNSGSLEISVWADVQEGASPDDAASELQAFAREKVREEYVRLHKSNQANKK